jgi:hypothetical protein
LQTIKKNSLSDAPPNLNNKADLIKREIEITTQLSDTISKLTSFNMNNKKKLIFCRYEEGIVWAETIPCVTGFCQSKLGFDEQFVKLGFERVIYKFGRESLPDGAI